MKKDKIRFKATVSSYEIDNNEMIKQNLSFTSLKNLGLFLADFEGDNIELVECLIKAVK